MQGTAAGGNVVEEVAAVDAVPAIPESGLLLHIGVFKTGTTALQETLRYSRKLLSAHQVLYLGPSLYNWTPIRDLMKADGPEWAELRGRANNHSGRVIVSSENLCGGSDAEAAQAVAQLGAERPVHVLMTVRSLAEMLPSTWQQFVKRRMSTPYDEWVKTVLADPLSPDNLFWRRNNFAEQVRRWGALVGLENMTVAVADKRQPDRLLRIAEGFLDLPDESLQFHPRGKMNPSMSFAESEFLRRVNEATTDALSNKEYQDLVRMGVFPGILGAQTDGAAAIPVPDWAAPEMAEIGADQARRLRESGVRIIGDIDSIAVTATRTGDASAPPHTIGIDTAAAAVAGALHVAVTRKQPAAASPPPAQPTARKRKPMLRGIRTRLALRSRLRRR